MGAENNCDQDEEAHTNLLESENGKGGFSESPRSDASSSEGFLRVAPDSAVSAVLEATAFARRDSIKLTEKEQEALLRRKNSHRLIANMPATISEGVADDQTTVIIRKATLTQTFFNVMKNIIGAGVLSVPHVYRTGLGVSWGVTMFVVLWVWDSIRAMVQVRQDVVRAAAARGTKLDKNCHGTIVIYEGLGRSRAGSLVSWLWNISNIVGSIGVVVAFLDYMVLMAEEPARLMGYNTRTNPYRLLLPAAIGVAEIPLLLMRTLRWLSVTSFLGVLCIATALCVVMYDMVAHPKAGSVVSKDSPGEIKWYSWDMSVIHMLGNTIFLYTFHAVVYALESSMAKRAAFGRVVSCALFTCAFFQTLFGTLGYLLYGMDAKEMIFDNMEDRTWSNVCKLLVFFELYFTIPLIILPAREIVENYLINTGLAKLWRKHPEFVATWTRNTVRVLFMVCCVTGAVAVPGFKFAVDITAGLPTTFICFMVPYGLHAIVSKPSPFRKMVDIFFVVLALAIGMLLLYAGLTQNEV